MSQWSVRARLAVLGGLLVYCLVVVWNAWVAEDAYICLRTVDNCVHGRGLTWNPGERVQSFTCPLWVLLLTGVYWFTHEAFLTTLAVSLVVSAAAAGVLALGVARGPRQGLLVVALLTCSKASVDYATSGLENPLNHLLLALFALVFLCHAQGGYTPLLCALLAALGAVNRLDTVLLYVPALLYLFFSRPTLGRALTLLLGFAPLLAWELFAIVYFGFPFPNTAYAKLGTGISQMQLLAQGWRYLLHSMTTDPLTPAVIVAGLVLPFGTRDYRSLALSAGVLLYVLYVVKVGGDFMSGRFLTAPLILATALLARIPAVPWRLFWPVTATVVSVLALVTVPPPFLNGIYSLPKDTLIDTSSLIADEAAIYRPQAGLIRSLQLATEPQSQWVEQGRQVRRNGLALAIKQNVGFFGYYAGPEVTIIDPLALTDPLLARLPAVANPGWRIGHFARKMPEGYWETLATGQNHIQDPSLAEYHTRLGRIIRGPLFDAQRWREIWGFNTGQYSHLIDQAGYRDSTPPILTLAQLPAHPGEDGARQVFFWHSGLDVQMPGHIHVSRLEASLNDQAGYVLLFFDGERLVGRHHLPLLSAPGWGELQTRTIPVPEEAYKAGFDRVQILPEGTTAVVSLGGLRLIK